MKTATRPDDLEILGHRLQEGLQTKLSPLAAVRVQCQLEDAKLVILVQHPPDVKPDTQQTFQCLEQIVLGDYRSLSRRVQIYLRVAGQKQPYACYSFDVEAMGEVPLAEGRDAAEIADEETEADSPPQVEKPPIPHPWDEPIPESEPVAEAQPPEAPIPKAKPSKMSLLPTVVAGVGLSAVIFLGTLYVLTRPCTIGECRAIPEAEQLSQQSIERLQNPSSGKEVLEAQEQLHDAIDLLAAIPFWSKHHGQAQERLADYRAQAERVEDMVAALQTAARAAYASQNPPHPPAQWSEVQSLWREAITRLEQLPEDSNLQPLAQRKLKEYQNKLEEINQRIVKEQEANQNLEAAKEAALIARARQGVAQELSHWQLVHATWLTALNRLERIPQGTMAYEEAQALTADYRNQAASTRDRKTKEQIAANAYEQGVRLAQYAQAAQNKGQWSAAVIHWDEALTYASQIPSDTYYSPKAKKMVESYAQALQQAQAGLQVATRIQEARRDLNQACYGATPVCSYAINNNVIQVQLSPTYVQAVRQTAINSQLSRNSEAHAGIVNHVLRLEEVLEAIANNAQIPLEVYTSDGVLLESHQPG
jgi:hypothetical protein